MYNFFKSRLSTISLSKEYFLFLSIILSALFIVSAFYYCYSYSLHTSEKNERLVQLANNLKLELERETGFEFENKNEKLLVNTSKKTNSQAKQFIHFTAALEALSKNSKYFEDALKKVALGNDISFIMVDYNGNILFKSSEYMKENRSDICEQTSVNLIKGNSGFLSEPYLIDETSYSYYKKLNGTPYTIFTGFDRHVLERELHHEVLPKLYDLIFMGIFYLVVLFFFRRKIIGPIAALSKYAILISKGNTGVKIPKQNSIEMFNLAKALILVKHYIKRNEIYRKKLELANEIIRTSSEAREDFAKSINQQLTHPLKEILIYTEILLSDISKRNMPLAELQKSIKCIEKIREAAINIKSKNTGSMSLSALDFNSIIKQAIQINLKNSFSKKLDIITEFAEDLPSMMGDELKLTKVLVCLISQSIENSPENQVIKIKSALIMQEETELVQLTIEDNSFGLSEEELKRIQKNVGWENESSLFENREDSFVEKYVSMHQGSLHTKNQIHEGRTVVLTFPILTEMDLLSGKNRSKNPMPNHNASNRNSKDSNSSNNNNVVYLKSSDSE